MLCLALPGAAASVHCTANAAVGVVTPHASRCAVDEAQPKVILSKLLTFCLGQATLGHQPMARSFALLQLRLTQQRERSFCAIMGFCMRRVFQWSLQLQLLPRVAGAHAAALFGGQGHLALTGQWRFPCFPAGERRCSRALWRAQA